MSSEISQWGEDRLGQASHAQMCEFSAVVSAGGSLSEPYRLLVSKGLENPVLQSTHPTIKAAKQHAEAFVKDYYFQKLYAMNLFIQKEDASESHEGSIPEGM